MDYKQFYTNNPDFQRYVDRYCSTYRVSIDTALTHLLVRLTAKYYKEIEDGRACKDDSKV